MLSSTHTNPLCMREILFTIPLVDQLLRQPGTFGAQTETALPTDLERKHEITLLSQCTSMYYTPSSNDHTRLLNIVATLGQPDLGGRSTGPSPGALSAVALSLHWLPSSRALSFVVCLSDSFVVWAIHLVFFHPLSSIPGPWYAAVSSLWITTHVLRLEQCKTIHALFQTYGPVVRIAPNEIAFSDLGKMTALPDAQHSIRRKAYTSELQPEVCEATGEMIDVRLFAFFSLSSSSLADTGTVALAYGCRFFNTLPNVPHARNPVRYLDAFIKEGLRIDGAANDESSLSRSCAFFHAVADPC
ncbi:hypothetical protein C8F01DRAFT_1253543 [Mycena amicta]|nr:hypothetical protein C8F01DRAFT_1253543 [Mycena amicta]